MQNNRYIINFRLTWPVQKSVFVEVHPIIFKLFEWYNWNIVLKISILMNHIYGYIIDPITLRASNTKYYIEEGWKKLWKKKK